MNRTTTDTPALPAMPEAGLSARSVSDTGKSTSVSPFDPRRARTDRDEIVVVTRLHERALCGDSDSRDRLFAWVHATALNYYGIKTDLEPLLSRQDAQDLASDCVVEFAKCWGNVRSVVHYSRRMFKNNLSRFLKRRRIAIRRECSLGHDEMDSAGGESVRHVPRFDFERYSDEDIRKLAFIAAELKAADTIIQEIVRGRVLAGSLTYGEIARRTGATETSLRMRMARFNRRVRRRYARREDARNGAGPRPAVTRHAVRRW